MREHKVEVWIGGKLDAVYLFRSLKEAQKWVEEQQWYDWLAETLRAEFPETEFPTIEYRILPNT